MSSERFRMCLRKKRLDCIEAHDQSKRKRQRFYVCPYCGWYHLTTKRTWRR